MSEAITPVVQVVTGGTDWPAIIAAVATGVVGLAGILATYWSGNRRIGAEDARARLAQKSLMYTDCMTIFAETLIAVNLYHDEFRHAEENEPSWQAAEVRYEKAEDAMYTAVIRLRLGAPKKVSDLGYEFRDAIMRFKKAVRKRDQASIESSGNQLSDFRRNLENSMRADLGEKD